MAQFVQEQRILGQSIEAVDGIEGSLRDNLCGVDISPSILLGNYLKHRDEDSFRRWLRSLGNCEDHLINRCCLWLRNWTALHLKKDLPARLEARREQFVADLYLFGKDITDVDGIDEASGQCLRNGGHLFAHQLLGQYLCAGERSFKSWLRFHAGLRREELGQLERSCTCLRDWTRRHLAPVTKGQRFVSERMGNKPVGEVDGVGNRLRARLESQQYLYAKQLLGKYLENPDNFRTWLQDEFDASAEEQEDCYACLTEYCERNPI